MPLGVPVAFPFRGISKTMEEDSLSVSMLQEGMAEVDYREPFLLTQCPYTFFWVEQVVDFQPTSETVTHIGVRVDLGAPCRSHN